MNNPLAKLDAATRALAEAKSLDEVKKIHDIAQAAETYARAAKLGLQAQNHAAEIKLRAERKAGELLSRLDKSDGGRPGKNSTNVGRVSEYKKVLDDTETTMQDAGRWQTIAGMPDERFEAYIAEKKETGEITTAGLLRTGSVAPQDEPPTIEAGEYQTIVIDPPWPVEKIIREERPRQTATLDYPTMTTEAIEAIKLPMADNCHVYLWTTQKFLPASFGILEAWGVRYIQTLVWHKNVGFTPFGLFMNNVEFCLFGRKGSLPLDRVGMKAVFEAKVREHSRKPDEFYDLVREASPGPRIDIFSRDKRDGFDQWGNEIEKF